LRRAFRPWRLSEQGAASHLGAAEEILEEINAGIRSLPGPGRYTICWGLASKR
jgi:hypothetical protein